MQPVRRFVILPGANLARATTEPGNAGCQTTQHEPEDQDDRALLDFNGPSSPKTGRLFTTRWRGEFRFRDG
ncbi:hypothetical protein ZHAS_00018226 [Anopheles sinensis]|uniref:Uncharacterized protein n=1 Tax=Anopheles sinensis TaxID=74873 RepID=A0A084WHK9_ANOSI|nr:hypothetical protein ZHAS_00018226 [Anopheles sinensis]